MPSYKYEVKIPGKSAEELYKKIESGIDRFLEKSNMGKYEIKKSSETQKIAIESKFFTGELVCTDGALELSGSLSLFALPFKSKLDEGIEKWIAKTFRG